MNFPRLDIQVTNSHLILDKTPGKLDIQGQIPDFTLEKTPHKFDLYVKDAQIEVHNYGPRKQMGLKNSTDLTFEYAAKGKSAAEAAIGEYASQGDEMMQIENKSDASAEIARRNTEKFTSPGELNVAYFPEDPLVINVQDGGVDVKFEYGEVRMNSIRRLSINYEPGSSHNSIDRYPKVEINVVGENLDYIA